MLSYVFEPHSLPGQYSVHPQASWAKPTLMDALTMGRGHLFCVFEDERLKLIVDAEDALITFAFTHIYPRVTQSEKNNRLLAKLGYRYWIKKNVNAEQVEGLRGLLVQTKNGKHRDVRTIAAERLASTSAITVAQSACVASWWEMGEHRLAKLDLERALHGELSHAAGKVFLA